MYNGILYFELRVRCVVRSLKNVKFKRKIQYSINSKCKFSLLVKFALIKKFKNIIYTSYRNCRDPSWSKMEDDVKRSFVFILFSRLTPLLHGDRCQMRSRLRGGPS